MATSHYVRGNDHGIPWTVILSSDGAKLITSDIDPDSELDKRNIGFLGSEEGRRHFEYMLRSTAENLSSDDVSAIIQTRAGLLSAGERRFFRDELMPSVGARSWFL